MIRLERLLAEMCFDGPLDEMPAIAFEADREGNLLRLNRYGRNLFCPGESKYSGPVTDFMPIQGSWSQFISNTNGLESLPGTRQVFKGPAGFHSTIWLVAMIDIDEEQWTFVGVCYDLTQKSRLEGVLKSSRDKLRMIFDNLPQMILAVDANHRIVSANMAVARHAGIDIKKVIGRECWQVLKGTCNCPANAGEPFGPCPADKAFSLKKSHTSLLSWTSPDGRHAPLSVTSHPVRNFKGEVTQAAMVIERASDRTTATPRPPGEGRQEANRGLLEHSPVYDLILDATADLHGDLLAIKAYINEMRPVIERARRMEAGESSLQDEGARPPVDLSLLLKDMDHLLERDIALARSMRHQTLGLDQDGHAGAPRDLKTCDPEGLLGWLADISGNGDGSTPVSSRLKKGQQVVAEEEEVRKVLGQVMDLIRQNGLSPGSIVAETIQDDGDGVMVKIHCTTCGDEEVTKEQISPLAFEKFYTKLAKIPAGMVLKDRPQGVEVGFLFKGMVDSRPTKEKD